MAPAYYFILTAFILSAVLGFIILPKILIISHKHSLYDLPNNRKNHEVPIPRLGGVFFFPVIIITITLLMGSRYYLGYDIIYIPVRTVLIEFLFLLCGSCILFIIGVKDDLVGISYHWKFLAQIMCGFLFAFAGLWIHDGNGLFGIHILKARFGYPFAIFIVVYIINSFNLIDGIDGLASGLACISLTTLGTIFIQEKLLIYALMVFSTIGVVLPFSIYNVFGNQKKGRKIFMGDTGTLTLGLILSFLILKVCSISTDASQDKNYFLIGFSTMIIPLFDTVRVAVTRIINHKNPFLPDNNHIHHRLLKTGMKKRNVIFTILLLDVMYIYVNKCIIKHFDINIVLIIDIVIMIIIQYIVSNIIKKKNNGN